MRHMILNSIRSINVKYRKDYGNFVICTDGFDSWRKEVFPYYKHGRKEYKDSWNVDWTEIFKNFSEIKKELKEVFPYISLQVPQAEADDIIAVLAREYHRKENILIVSADLDFVQLQRYDGVKQYDHVHKKMVKIDDPIGYLEDHIIDGCSSDKIPNVLSADNVFYDGIKQTSLTKPRRKILQEHELHEYETLLKIPNVAKNYIRNKTLIDFNYIPQEISAAILQAYEDYKVASPGGLFKYFNKYKLKQLVSNIQDF